MTAHWIAPTEDGVRITVRVQPRASRTEVAGPLGNALKIRLASPPVDGAANRELVAFLSKRLRRPKSAITIRSGERGRLKTVLVHGIDPPRAHAALWPASTGE